MFIAPFLRIFIVSAPPPAAHPRFVVLLSSDVLSLSMRRGLQRFHEGSAAHVGDCSRPARKRAAQIPPSRSVPLSTSDSRYKFNRALTSGSKLVDSAQSTPGVCHAESHPRHHHAGT